MVRRFAPSSASSWTGVRGTGDALCGVRELVERADDQSGEREIGRREQRERNQRGVEPNEA
jgi:hypothetical protein